MRDRALLVAAMGLAATACVGPVPSSELPEDPIAILFYDPETARTRAEAMRDDEERRPASVLQAGGSERAVAQVGEITGYVKGLLGVESRSVQDEPGHLALYYPRSGKIEVVEGLRPNAMPMQWSPDRRRLLFMQIERENPKLFEWNRDTDESNRVTHGRTAHPEGCYGPEGSIVFTSVSLEKRGPNGRVVWKKPGTDPQPLSAPGVFASYPTCAPDGSAVAYVTSVRGRRQQIVVHSPVDGPPRVVAPGREPAFSPDSQWIVYSAPAGPSTWELRRVRPDGSARTSVGRGSLDEMRPTVSPDGRLVAYVAEQDEFRPLLFLRRFDGTGDRILLGTGASDRPVW